MRFSKPSGAWRDGHLLFLGWPAQEGGTDSRYHHPHSRNIHAPAESITDPTTAANYPAWWMADAQPSKPQPTPPAPPFTRMPPAATVTVPPRAQQPAPPPPPQQHAQPAQPPAASPTPSPEQLFEQFLAFYNTAQHNFGPPPNRPRSTASLTPKAKWSGAARAPADAVVEPALLQWMRSQPASGTCEAATQTDLASAPLEMMPCMRRAPKGSRPPSAASRGGGARSRPPSAAATTAADTGLSRLNALPPHRTPRSRHPASRPAVRPAWVSGGYANVVRAPVGGRDENSSRGVAAALGADSVAPRLDKPSPTPQPPQPPPPSDTASRRRRLFDESEESAEKPSDAPAPYAVPPPSTRAHLWKNLPPTADPPLTSAPLTSDEEGSAPLGQTAAMASELLAFAEAFTSSELVKEFAHADQSAEESDTTADESGANVRPPVALSLAAEPELEKQDDDESDRPSYADWVGDFNDMFYASHARRAAPPS